MSPFYLPNECIQDILKYVEEKDNKTLHSALLVNRTWCQNTVSFLWKKPFNSPPSDSQNNYKIIPILASFIDDDKKKQFKIKEKDLPVPKETTFDYPSFIRHLDFVNLWKQVFRCYPRNSDNNIITYNELYPLQDNDYKLIQRKKNSPQSLQDEYKSSQQKKAEVVKVLYEVILQRSRLERLTLSMKDWHYPIYNEFIFDALTSTPNARNALARLTRFDCNLAATSIPVLHDLSRFSKKIKILSIQIFRHIYRDGQLTELSRLIESQDSLEQINIFKDHKCNDISIDLSSLVSQSQSLKKLKLHYVNIDDDQLEYITKLHHLQELMFTCVRLRGKMILLTNVLFTKLKVLRIYSTFINNGVNNMVQDNDPFVGLIRNNGSHLRDLSLEFKLGYHPQLLNNVANHCENLITFTTYYNEDDDMPGIYNVLKKCSKIELFGIDGFANMSHKTIIEFSKLIPPNVRKLDFRYDCLEKDTLEVFLEHYEGHDVKYLICNVKGDKQALKDMIEEISINKGRKVKKCSVEREGSEKIVNIEW